MKTTKKVATTAYAVIGWFLLTSCVSKPAAEVYVEDVVPEPTPVSRVELVASAVIVADEVAAEEIADEPLIDENDPNAARLLAERDRARALKAMARADELLGATAAKQQYGTANAAFKNGDKNFAKEDYEAARFDFHSAAESFNLLADSLESKRQIAADALSRAKVRVADSEAFALAADAAIPPKEAP